MTQVDLTHSTSSTLPNQARKQVQHLALLGEVLCTLACCGSVVTCVSGDGQLTTLCVSPDGIMLLAVDEDGKALLINRKRRVLLHHISFADHVAAAAFSPNGAFIACAVGRMLQVPHVVPLLSQCRFVHSAPRQHGALDDGLVRCIGMASSNARQGDGTSAAAPDVRWLHR